MAQKLLKLSTHLFVPLSLLFLSSRGWRAMGERPFLRMSHAAVQSHPQLAGALPHESQLRSHWQVVCQTVREGWEAHQQEVRWHRSLCGLLIHVVSCLWLCSVHAPALWKWVLSWHFFLLGVALSDMLCLLLFGCDMVWCSSGWALLQQAQGSQFLCLVECVGYWTHTSRVRGSAPTAAPDANIQYVLLWLLIKRLLLNVLYCTRDLLLMFYLLLISI